LKAGLRMGSIGLANYLIRMVTYQKFLTHYNIPVTPKQFASVFGAIPSGVIILFKGQF